MSNGLFAALGIITFLVLINSRLIITHRTGVVRYLLCKQTQKVLTASDLFACWSFPFRESGVRWNRKCRNYSRVKQTIGICLQTNYHYFYGMGFSLFSPLTLVAFFPMFVCSSTTQVAAEVIISLVGWNYEVFNSIQYLIFSRVSLSYNNALCEDRAKSVLSVEGTKLVRFHVNQQLSSP